MTMPERISALIEELDATDPNVRSLALAKLVGRGREATPALVRAFERREERLRTLAAQGLAEIADPTTAEVLARALNDELPEVRARAAQGLARLKDRRAISALVQTLDDFPDILHHPYTLSTYLLIEAGVPALPAVAPLLKHADLTTRTRAFLVVQSIVSQLPQVGDWAQLARSLGAYDPAAPAPIRDAAADQWQDWITRQHEVQKRVI